MHGEDPVIFLIPKHMLWAERESKEPVRAVPFGAARKRQSGSDVTVVAWGNTMEKSLEALAKIGRRSERRADRSALDRRPGTRPRSKNRCARPDGSLLSRKTRRIAVSGR